MRRRHLVTAVLCLLAIVPVSYVGLKAGTHIYNARRFQALHGRRVYDEKADSRTKLSAALAEARASGKHVLVIIGGNWCQWCLSLDELMEGDAEIRNVVSEHFVLLKLDVARVDDALNASWGDASQKGVPVLVFLSADGTLLHVQETYSLESFGGRLLAHNRQRVLTALRTWG